MRKSTVHYGWTQANEIATLCGRAGKNSVLTEDMDETTCKLCLRELAADLDEWNEGHK